MAQRRDSNDRIPGDPRNPDPSQTPGLEPGGGVAPGDTPPIADTQSESQAVSVEHEHVPDKGPKVAVAIIVAIAALMAIGFLAMAVLRADLF